MKKTQAGANHDVAAELEVEMAKGSELGNHGSALC
jgi:hypothetical protein